MSKTQQTIAGWALMLVVGTAVGSGQAAAPSSSVEASREALLQELQEAHALNAEQMVRVRAVFARSPWISQGNPAITRHPATPAECRAKLAREKVDYANPEWTAICGAPYMAPLYDPAHEKPTDAMACIDQFEFPNIPCAYPVIWVRASEAALLCEAMDKRLCDAHEWEGACAGTLEPPDYNFAAAGVPSEAVSRLRKAHNLREGGRKSWAYGPEPKAGICAAASSKSPGCNGGDWQACGSNTYPAGFFPACHSTLGVYDQHGNAAEHMNLPLAESEMASHGSTTLGVTEMKGSWFIFDTYKAHEDWCRWRAPYWHGSKVRDPKSHHNYHLGFRCCKTIERVE